MRIVEKVNEKLNIDVCKLSADSSLTYYDKKTNTNKPAKHIDETPWPNKCSVIAVSAPAGAGKTTLAVSLIASNKPKSKVYHGCFDQVLICAPPSTLKSIVNNPFIGLEDQTYEKFDEEFLDIALSTCEKNSLEGKTTCLFIDDAGNSLKENKRIIDKMGNIVVKHRHLLCFVILMVQDLIMLSTVIRENLSSIVVFKGTNNKRSKIFKDEYFDELTMDEFLKLNSYLYQKKGDFLHISLNTFPRKYYRNNNQLFLNNLDNNYDGSKDEEVEKTEKSEKTIEKKTIEKNG
jgi:hypothetical protein